MRGAAAFARRAAATLLSIASAAHAAPPTAEEIAKLCNDAEGPAHCGRVIEAQQLKRLPNLAQRDGPTLTVRLFPTGEARFEDRESLHGGATFSLFDYLNEFNAVVLWTTDNDKTAFTLLQRTTGRQTPVPSQPVPSPSGGRFATADFCPTRCENQLVVWQVSRDGVRREYSWRPAQPWADAAVRWKDADTLVVEYTREGEETPRNLERRLNDPGWTRGELR